MKPAQAAFLALLSATPAAAQAPVMPSFVQPLAPPAIMQVQERLRQQGFYAGRADGAWGADSQTALERFQQSRGLQVSGQLNAATASMLGIDPVALVAAAPAPPPEPLSAEVVRAVQQRLRVSGQYRGGVDGVWGPGTQRALERFQQARGLQATGQMNPATAQALGLDPNNLGGSARPR